MVTRFRANSLIWNKSFHSEVGSTLGRSTKRHSCLFGFLFGITTGLEDIGARLVRSNKNRRCGGQWPVMTFWNVRQWSLTGHELGCIEHVCGLEMCGHHVNEILYCVRVVRRFNR